MNYSLKNWLRAGVLALVFGYVPTAAAQQIDLNQFRPSERAEDGFAVSTASDLGHLTWGAQLYFDYTDDPLVFETTGDSDSRLVDQQLTGHLQFSLGLWDRLVVFAELPVHMIIDGDEDVGQLASLRPASGGGLGDMRLGARVRLYGTHADLLQLAFQGSLDLHTASAADSDQNYRGGDSTVLGGHPEMLVTVNLHRLRLSGNLGIRFRADVEALETRFGDELTYGFGLLYRVVDAENKLDLIAELFGRSGLSEGTGSTGFGTNNESPAEILVGGKYHHNSGVSFGAGAGTGVIAGYGAPDFRLLLMVAYTSASSESSKDSDGDGLLDDEDECPDEAEAFDDFHDHDGCPDLDNDGDGIADTDDQCPDEKGVAEAAGCPIQDRDGDGVQDADDQCPDDAGTPEAQGCPLDRDGDGVPDDQDECPDEAGTVKAKGCPPDTDDDGVPDDQDDCPNQSGTPEAQGCPDGDSDTVSDKTDSCPHVPGTVEHHGCKEPPRVEVDEHGMKILDKIYFGVNSARIKPRSFAMLNRVATVIKEHPHLETVRVEAHTDERGPADFNLKLSQRRAQAVVDYLTGKGVAEDRLLAKGLGSTQPAVLGAHSAKDHAANRRVEFNVAK